MIKIVLGFLMLLPRILFAQLEVIPARETPLVFGGSARTLEIIFKNPADKTFASALRTRLYQASSATLAPVNEIKLWKQLQILAGQTVIEKLVLDLPVVVAVTEFRIRFSTDEKQIADLKIQLAPENLLKEISMLAEKTPVGVLDPDNQLKPLLKKNEIEFHDLEKNAGFDDFHGKLAIIGPFLSKDSVPENLRNRLVTKREKPIAVVWMQPPGAKSNPLLPVYLLRENENVIVIVQNEVVGKLAESPGAQLNLLRATQLALHPESLGLPEK